MLDLNSDLGEGSGTDAALLPLLSSANVCCGAHAGDTATIQATLALCAQLGVTVGAHPGYPDREHFGRVEHTYTPSALRDLVQSQLQQLKEWATTCGVHVKYVKPHGALYHQCHRDPVYARVLVDVAVEEGLAVMGLPDSLFAEEAKGKVRYIAEGFADRRYLPDGSLVPRTEPHALLTDPQAAVAQVLQLTTRGIESICVHGDTPQALAFVQQIRAELERRNIRINAVL